MAERPRRASLMFRMLDAGLARLLKVLMVVTAIVALSACNEDHLRTSVPAPNADQPPGITVTAVSPNNSVDIAVPRVSSSQTVHLTPVAASPEVQLVVSAGNPGGVESLTVAITEGGQSLTITQDGDVVNGLVRNFLSIAGHDGVPGSTVPGNLPLLIHGSATIHVTALNYQTTNASASVTVLYEMARPRVYLNGLDLYQGEVTGSGFVPNSLIDVNVFTREPLGYSDSWIVSHCVDPRLTGVGVPNPTVPVYYQCHKLPFYTGTIMSDGSGAFTVDFSVIAPTFPCKVNVVAEGSQPGISASYERLMSWQRVEAPGVPACD